MGVARQSPPLRLAATEKTNLCLQKRSMLNASMLIAKLMTLTICRLSREEREAAYNKARERIFGNTEKSGDATPGKQAMHKSASTCVLTINIDTEDGNDISRSSSVSGRAKRGKMVKKHRTDSESFDVRSQYTPFFPPQQPQPWTPTQPGALGTPQYSNVLQNSFSGPAAPQYGPTPPQFHPSMVAGGAPTAYHQMPQVSHQLAVYS